MRDNLVEVLQKSETADCITDKGDGEQAVGYILEKAKAVGFTLEKTSEAPQPHAFARAKADVVIDVAKNTLENNLSFTISPSPLRIGDGLRDFALARQTI